MKAVLISIKPKWCELIASGKKTVEVRKTQPKLEPPFKVYIYCTQGYGKNTFNCPVFRKTIIEHYAQTGSMDCINSEIGNCKVIGEFVCDRIYQYASDLFRSAPLEGVDISTEEMEKLSCLTAKELYKYEHSAAPRENCVNLVGVYGWHISDLQIYEKPKPLSEFRRPCDNDLYCEECGMYSENRNRCGNGALQLTRPPQSWCYVEGVLTDG
jgi:predicted transcriptional regulator